MKPVRYDRIGKGYAGYRQPEPTWVAQVNAALGDAATIVNVGAGTGNYEPESSNTSVVAVEPSVTMIEQRAADASPAVRGVAEALPFPAGTFDAALGMLTVHHWTDQAAGLAELRRVSRRQVLMVFEIPGKREFWLDHYFPEATEGQVELNAPSPEFVGEHLDLVDVQIMWVPHDCADGVAAAYWRRPEAYLVPEVQQSMSFLALLTQKQRDEGTERLAEALANGEWEERFGHLRDRDVYDAGYRLAIAGD